MKTKKIVVNRCFGGFGLSPLAVKRLAELNGKDCFFFETPLSDVGYKLISDEKAVGSFCWSAFSVKNPESYMRRNGKKWHEMSLKERKSENNRYRKIELSTRDIPRDDKNLIRVVEELGEKANGRYAELKIIEIPADVDWVIEEYDGSEHIAEKHRTW